MKSIKFHTYFLTAALFLILAVLIGFAVNSALKERWFVHEYKIRNALTSHLNLAAQFQAVERGLGATLLGFGKGSEGKKMSKLHQDFMEAGRKGDEHVRQSIVFANKLEALKKYHALQERLDNLRSSFNKLKTVRQGITNHDVTVDEWVSVVTVNINNEFKLRDYTFIPDDKEEYKESELAYLRSIFHLTP